MGPRSFNRGNAASRTSLVFIGFLLQWGRGLSTAEMGLAPLHGLGLRGLQWGRGLSTAEIRRGASPASCLQSGLQWGRGLSTAEIGFGDGLHGGGAVASMGPRSFNRGNRTLPPWAPIRRSSFNGAAVFQPRKCPALHRRHPHRPCFNGAAVFQPRKWFGFSVICAARDMLQWGRGLSTAEMRNSIRFVG